MAATSTLKFLPAIFQTDTNKKFISATLDQLTSDANLQRVNGYIGRKFAPTYKTSDNYVTEPTARRRNYQLEPTVVVQDKQTNTVDLFSSYIDLIQQIEVLGGNTSDHSRLFSSESYTYDGLFDFDKFGNYNNYYWLPNGPDAVNVFAGTVDTNETFTVTRNLGAGGYNFSGQGAGANPVLTLARGGTYKFNLSQTGKRFWIQTEPGISGTKAKQNNVSTRNIYGVQNNGASIGQVAFNIPKKDAQDAFNKMPQTASVDFATDYSYTNLQNRLLSSIQERYPDAFDGVVSALDKKTVVFINAGQDDAFWETPGVFDKYDEPFDTKFYDAGQIVNAEDRHAVWTINLIPVEAGDYLVVLTPGQVINPNERVYIKSGTTYATEQFYLTRDFAFTQIPIVTSNLDRLYYQDAEDPTFYGLIQIVDAEGYSIDVANNILGQKAYTSPNGVVFTNGLKIAFDDSVTDSQYANNEYYVEGVGTGIRLIKVSDLVTTEAYASSGINTPDYITINRDSIDSNAWSRSNRWFHVDVINATATYNKTVALPDQNYRAQRPIIEFEGHVQLFNHSRVAKNPIDLFVNGNVITDAMNTVEGVSTGGLTHVTISGITFTDGDRVIFADDFDPSVRNSIYVVNVIDTTGSYDGGSADRKLHLVLADDYIIEEGHGLVVRKGSNAGLNFWYNGTAWKSGQLKTGVNQAPLFDVIDQSGVSIGNTTSYPVTSFAGTKIFSYKVGAGTNDKVLGFPLSYRNFNSIGDIQFVNDFDADSFTYASGLSSTVSVPVNKNFLRRNTDLTTYVNRNIWVKNRELTKQYQVFSYAYDGTTNYFPVDVAPSEETQIPYTKVFLNNKLLKSADYEYKAVGARSTVRIIPYTELKVGDKIDILIYSKTPSATGYYEIPKSLDFNSMNDTFTSLTLGQIRNHIKTIEENTKQAVDVGDTYTGLRDIVYKSNGGNIIQHAAPAMYSNIFLTDEVLNFSQAIDLAAREYSRFKNKFLELATKLNDIDSNDIPGSVDLILKSINSIKNNTFPWYYSDMVPYGDDKNVINYSVINPFQKQYEISQVFNNTQLSNVSVLVYHNGVQLVDNVGFSFPQDRSAIIISNDITLVAGDTIRIVEYNNTDGSFVPETPSKLGLYPKFIPQRFVDDSYVTPVEVIQGHDGSITPIFKDIRDDLLLELEKRIYNNIKIDYETHIFDLYDHLPGKFRTTDYSLKEFTQILSNRFLRWVGDNKVDYSTNSYFTSNDAWTWNYKKFKDRVDGSFLPGTWRAVFNHFFDTYRPNTHPWEMLGFGKKPSWWEDRYGPAPYTGSNTLLWDDLESGYIHAGTRAGIDTRFARPGLSKIIPVDDYGSLLSPEQWAAADFSSLKANASYAVGDQGPVEFAWRTSSHYPFALQYALALAKPGYYFGSLINIDRYYRNESIDQLVNNETEQRITPTTVVINGDSTSGTTVRTAGYLNWVRDYVLNLGIDPVAKIQGYMSKVNIQLGYKLGGYTDKKFIEVLAEQGSPTNTKNSIVVPTENYDIILNKSTPIRKAVYSAVVVQQTQNGYTVSGYNQNNPYFTIIPSLANNNFYTIQALKRRATIYKDHSSTKVTVPYGYEFSTVQQVVDFLVSYGRYLVAQGFKFDLFDETLGETRNWVLSSKEFLNWSQQGWDPGSIIILSPIFNKLVNVQPDGIISEIKNTPTGTKILDQNSNFIKNTQFTEVRDKNTFTLSALAGQTICFADLTVVQYEHAMLFDNVTVFNDILYVPELGNRQYRLKLIGSKTGGWTGAFNPPGFVFNDKIVDTWRPGTDYLMGSIVEYKNQYYTALADVAAATEFVQDSTWRLIGREEIKTGLLPNFSYLADRLQQIYDVDNLPPDVTFEGYGTSLIGFRQREYLSNFGLDETSQVKFYQGYIKDKGTMNAITGLTHAQTDSLTSGINVYEEWALRVGEYGSMTSDQIVEVLLDEGVVTANPAAIEFLNPEDVNSATGIIGLRPVDLYKAPADFDKHLFFNRSSITDTINDIQTAGYPSLVDINDTIFSFDNYAELDDVLNRVGPGYYIWAAKDYTGEWNVFRASETQINVVNISYDIDNFATITFSDVPSLAVGDLFAVKAFNTQFNAFYQVSAINGERSVQVVAHKNVTALKDLKSVSGYGIFYRLSSSRVPRITDANSKIPLNGWLAGDKIWVDSSDNNGDWAVYEKINAWNQYDVVNDEAASKNAYFGTVVSSNRLSNNFFVGMPNYTNTDGSTGVVKTFSRSDRKGIKQTSKFDPRSNVVSNYGQTISSYDYTVVISAPTSYSNQGFVYVHNLVDSTTQIIRSNVASSNDFFGNSTAISSDNSYIYIGAPGKNTVYVYNYNDSITSKSNTISYISGNLTIPYVPADKYAMQINDQYKNYVVDIDFSITSNTMGTGANVTLINPPPAYTQVTVNQRPYYKNIGTVIRPSDISSGDRFGEAMAVSLDGYDLYIGAPGQNSNAGAVYIYKKFRESFNSIRENTYVATYPFSSLTRVYVDGRLQASTAYSITSSTHISFNNPLPLGKVITVVSDQYQLIQKITEPSAVAGNLFGSKITIDEINSSTVFISSPGTAFSNGQVGAVYRYSDVGKITGTVLASNYPEYVKTLVLNGSTFNSNIGMYINNYYVDLSSANMSIDANSNVSVMAESISTLINNAKIPMVSASTDPDGFVRITSINKNYNNKLSITPNGSNLFSQIGLNTYSLDQIIEHPMGSYGNGFAQNIKYSAEAETLVVTSSADDVYYLTEIDTGATTFDQGSTQFINVVKSSGSTYVYELLKDYETGTTNTGTISYVQHIKSTNLKSNDQFGASADITKNMIFIGAPGDDTIITNAGMLHVYENLAANKSWSLIRQQDTKVDLDNVNKVFLYNKNTQNIVATLDYIDPAKGKILGIAEQDIDYKTALDPAIYNTGTDNTVVYNNGYHWNERQVGKIWWNLRNLRFVDYEQGDLIYRTNNWGKLFPGSQVRVCEWIESKYKPEEYVANGGDGIPLYYTNSANVMGTTLNTGAYVTMYKVDAGIITPYYYYWVYNKQNAPVGKHNSVKYIADIIENPQLQGVPYAFLMRDNALGLVNVAPYLDGTNIVLHVDYQTIVNDNSVHAEYELINENDPNSTIPTRIVDKLIDSLSGLDSIGQVVPDPTLTAANKIGLSIRPRQTLVINRSVAVENFVKYVNQVLIQYPIVYQYSLLGLEKEDPIPASTEYNKVVPAVEDLGYIDTTSLTTGYKVLVTSDSTNSGLWTIYRLDSNKEFKTHRIQYYNTKLYWSKVDWYASDYDPTSRINYTVSSYKDIAALSYAAGEIIRVNYDDNGQFSIYRAKSDLTLEKVGIQNGTIQLSDTLYNLPKGQMGWDEDRFDTIRYDQTPSIEVRNILLALRDDIFVGNLGNEFNKLFFVLVNYILQEQQSVDWIFKTSFISIFHKLRELSQPASYVLDNQEYYEKYIDEVKPYRTIMREYVVDYVGNDAVESNVTDFDLPSIYNKKISKYRTPDGSLSTDTSLITTTAEYQYWKAYHTFTIDSIEVSNTDNNFLIEPIVTITGGGGTGATAEATIWGNGAIKTITVTNAGVGYTSQPTVRINGTGSANAAARLTNKTVRQFDSVLKFDRTAYSSDVQIWSNANAYVTGDIVAYNGSAYRATTEISRDEKFNFDAFELITGEEVGNTNDRIIAYIASRAQSLGDTTVLGQEIQRTLDNRYYLTKYVEGLEYPGTKVQGLLFNANIKDQQLVDSIIQSRYVDTGLGQRPEDIIIDGGAYIDYYSSHAPEELLPGVVHESIDISVFTREVVSQANTTVLDGGVTFAYREFFDINGSHNYFRISGFSTAYLVAAMDIYSDTILVNNIDALPTPDLVRAIPGVCFIDGEKITYWGKNVEQRTLYNIRRGVSGTPIQPHLAGATVYDVSTAQTIPDLQPRTITISDNASFDSNVSWNYWKTTTGTSVFTVSDKPTYKLALFSNVTVQPGDTITQVYSNANAYVRGNATSSKSIAIVMNSGQFTTANANCVIQINGVSTLANVVSVNLLGSINANGTVVLHSTGSNIVIKQDKLAWLDYDYRDQGLQFQDSASLPAREFLGQGASTATLDLSSYYSIEEEESVNTILITENNQLIIGE